MLKRQDSSLSSSRRLTASATPPPPEAHHAKAIGCMSGIIQLFSKYQNPNKRLTFGRKQVKRKQSSPKKDKCSAIEEERTEMQNFDKKKLTCDIKVRRSPTLPPEIRRSNSPSSPEDSSTPSSLVARIMGLEDISADSKKPSSEEDPIAEKRQQLLEALEKCNEDLEALKRIIKAVQTANLPIQPSRGHSGGGNAGSLEVKSCAEKCLETNTSTVAELTHSPLGGSLVAHYTTADDKTTFDMHSGALRLIPQQRKPTTARKPGEDDQLPAAKLFNKYSPQSSLLMRRRAAEAAATASPPQRSSRAMVQSVEEVCGDVARGEKREIGRIGLVLQDHLCRELIGELVKEMKSCSNHSLPLEACKRRLSF